MVVDEHTLSVLEDQALALRVDPQVGALDPMWAHRPHQMIAVACLSQLDVVAGGDSFVAKHSFVDSFDTFLCGKSVVEV